MRVFVMSLFVVLLVAMFCSGSPILKSIVSPTPSSIPPRNVAAVNSHQQTANCNGFPFPNPPRNRTN
ncbi:unnamed protein product [Phyllotreta striolata]|uniref:Uncharacterized protein n=1 Tax=Phyllotreta striolata TaxID=444603 RepID=A0A9N9TRV5_PHYSR|nr:unnamed protein product [Phyllotreta striolata]